MKQLLALLLLLSSVVSAQQTAGTTALDPTQVYTTGNVVLPTVAGTNQTPWVNGVYQDQLTCWGWGNPGNCGPNPTVRPGGYINYSFGYTDLHQVQAISSILPQTGLRVNGYTFGFTAKNGNGWDDGRLDQLNAYVAFYGTDGKVKDYTNYNLNSQFNWTTFSYSKDFVTPYADKDLSTVQYGFTGKDNNFWAGTYGPEIMNVNFSLKYSVDPCAVNVLSSPTCPGYLAALTSLSGTGTTSTATTTDTTTTLTLATGDLLAPPPPAAPPPPPPPGQQQPGPPPPGGPAPTTNVATSTTTTSASATAQANTAPASVPAKEGAPAQTSGTTLGLSVIGKNKDREQAIATQAVQTATATAAAAAANSQQEAMAVATQATATSTTFAAATNTSMSSGTGIKMSSSSSSMSLPGMNPDVMPTSSSQQSQIAVMSGVSFTSSAAETKLTYSPITTQSQSSALSANVDTQPLAPTDFLTNRTNPLTEIIESKPMIPQTNTASMMGSSVNRNAADNEAAGGVDLTKMAVAPVGYNAYLNLTLRDVAFYAPKEVYPNQRTVDNARALRLLTNDARHQELVDLQYKGN